VHVRTDNLELNYHNMWFKLFIEIISIILVKWFI